MTPTSVKKTAGNGSLTLMQTNGEPVSLYVHIPFCTRKCGYCHFYVIPDKPEHHALLWEGLALERELWADDLLGKEIVSLYIGGGTPSLASPSSLKSFIHSICLKQDAEITLEVNPETATEEKLRAFFDAGINRLSFGAQSFHDNELTYLTRTHSAAQTEKAIHTARKIGYDNITLDLMYELPGQTVESWKTSLKKAASLPVDHISLYNLTIEPHTAFFKRTIKQPGEAISAELYTTAIDTLKSEGFSQYELSAFCKNKQSLHNVGYWTARPFLGFGPSAFSYWNGSRFCNPPRLHKWHAALKEGRRPKQNIETLIPSAAARELFVLHLRLNSGVASENLPSGCDLTDLLLQKLIVKRQNRYRLTAKGQLLFDEIASLLI